MHIVVCVKQTPDSASVYIDPISGQVDEERFVQILNPADACAVEAAVRLAETFPESSVTVISLGPRDIEGALRASLAIGATTALRLWHQSASSWGPLSIARALAEAIRNHQPPPDLVLCGDHSSDWASSTVGPALASYLDLPQVTSVSRLAIKNEQNQLTLHLKRTLERGYHEVIEAALPVLLTVTQDLNEARYPSLPAHLAALKATIPVYDLERGASISTEESTLLEIHVPRPRPHHIATPDSHDNAYRRIGAIIAGGTASRNTRLIEGSAEELAQELVTFLRGKGFA